MVIQKGFRIITGREWTRLQNQIGPITARITDLVIKSNGRNAQIWIQKLKKFAPFFKGGLINSIELRRGAPGSAVGGRGTTDNWFITISAPYAAAQEFGVIPHFVPRDRFSLGGYPFGEWLDTKLQLFNVPGLFVGVPGRTRMGEENAFFSKAEREMIPIVEREVAKMFTRVDGQIKRLAR